MFLADVSIKRPVFATILNLVLIVFGLFTYSKLGVELIPNIDFPVITVSVTYPGADPENVEQKIIKPLEKALNGLPGLDRFSANAYPNIGMITLAFKIGISGQQAAQDVRDKLGTVVLPQEAFAPLLFKLDIGAMPVLTLALSKGVGDVDIAALAKDRIKPALEQVPGVGSVDLVGLREREIQVRVSREKLQTFGISPSQVIQAIQGQKADIPSGKIENKANVIRIRTEGNIKTLNDIGGIVIPLRSGQKIRVDDVATVNFDLAPEESYASYNGNEALIMQVKKQSGGNSVALAKGALAKIEDIKRSLPKGVKLDVAQNTATFIESSLSSVKLDLILGALLAIVIVLFFLHDWRATVISALAIPTAVIGTIAFVYAFGFTINVITSLALTLSIGILVDDAIVVIENIYRRLQLGDPPMVAAAKGTSEIGLAALAITLSIVAVFGPVAFMEGIIGQFFYSFGVTVACAVLLSLFVAFTLTPMLSSRLLKEGSHNHIPFIFKPVNKFLLATDAFYRKTLQVSLQHRFITILIAFVVLVLTVFLARFVPFMFFPREDRGELAIQYTMEEGVSLAAAKQKGKIVDEWLRKYPGVERVITTIGSGQEKKPNGLSFSIKLVAKERRDFTQFEAQDNLRQELKAKFLAKNEVIEVGDAGGMGGGGQKPITLVLLGNNYDELIGVGNELKEVLQKIPGVVDASTSEPPTSTEYRVVANSTMAADLGLNTAMIGQTVRSLYEGIKVADHEIDGVTYDVKLKLADADSASVASLTGLSVLNAQGLPIPLSSVAEIKTGPSPSRIERFSGMRSLTISANYTGKDLGTVNNLLVKEAQKRVTPTVTYSVEGQGRMMAESVASFVTTLLLAVVLVFMVLAAQFESYLTPFVIMLSVPLSFIGAILGLLITGREFSMYPMIGILLLVGIVTKNAILLIDFTLQHMRQGMSVHDSLLEAGPIRLRPILMTTFAMIFGMVPIAIGHGEGGEARAPMAIAVIGGLITSTVLTLIVIPTVFSLLQTVKDKLSHKKVKMG